MLTIIKILWEQNNSTAKRGEIMHIGNRIRKIRKKINISVPELAEKINYSESYITHVEGGSSNPSDTFIKKISQQLKVPIEYIEDSNKPLNDLNIFNQFGINDIRKLLGKYSNYLYRDSTHVVENNVRTICDCLDLPYYFNDKNEMFVNEDIFNLLDFFYMNQELYLKEKESRFLSHREALEILGSKGRSFDVLDTSKIEQYRKNWLNLIDTFPVQFYYYRNFYFLKSDILNYISNIVSTEEIRMILIQKYNLKVPKAVLRSTLYSDYSHLVIDWLPDKAGKRYPIDIIDQIKDVFNSDRLSFKKGKRYPIDGIEQKNSNTICGNGNDAYSYYTRLYYQYIFPITNIRLSGDSRKYEKTIVNICESLNLPYTDERNLGLKYGDDTGHLSFDEDVYKKFEEFFINKSYFLKGEGEYITFKEAVKLIGNINSQSTFNITGHGSNQKHRNNWLSFIKHIPVRFFYKRSFYFLKSDVLTFKNSIRTTEELLTILTQKYNLYVYYGNLISILKKKYSNDVIDWIGQAYRYPVHIIDSLLEEFPENLSLNSSYIPYDEAVKMLGISSITFTKFFNEKLIKVSNNQQPFISKDEVNYWMEIKKNTIPFSKLLADMSSEVGWDTDSRNILSYYGRKLNEKIESNSISFINGRDTPFDSKTKYFFMEDINKIKLLFDEVDYERTLKNMSGIDRFKLFAKDYSNSKAPITMKEIYTFALSRLNLKGTYISHIFDLYKTISRINKELMSFKDAEIEKLLNNYLKDKGKNASIHFCLFISELQRKYRTEYKNNYQYDKHLAFGERDVSPYTEEQYFRFGFLILNDSHVWYQGYLEKALSHWRFSSLWLYGLLHYLCAWRRQDMIKQLPSPTLDMEPDEFIGLVRNNDFTEEMAYKITTEVEMKVRYMNLKPLKTNDRNPPNLVLEVPESARYRLGMLLGLCEAHRQKSNKDTLIMKTKILKDVQIEFFGSEFNSIFGGTGLNNIRLNKTFEILIAKKADENKIGTGYILASFARSHKCNGEQKSNTTLVYLEGYRKLTNGELVMRELFERGVCSFIPYLVLKTIEGEENLSKMSLPNQTQLIKSISKIHPSDIETVITVTNEVLQRANEEAMSILKQFGFVNAIGGSNRENAETQKEKIYRFLSRIASGTAPARENNMNCISVAKGIGCINQDRTSCIGCGQEIYLKSTIYLIGQKLRASNSKIFEGITENEKYKYKQLVEQMYKPALREILVILQSVYGINDVSEYRDLAFGLKKIIVEESDASC